MEEFFDNLEDIDVNILQTIINSFIVDNDDNNDSEKVLEPQDKKNNESEMYGCKHYLRRCKIVSPCCHKIYSCRLCHDEENYDGLIEEKLRHRIDRFKIAKVICTECNKEQDCKQYCENCHICFGLYYCDICHLFDDIDKNQFHCEKCGMCRIGGRDNFVHCDDCGVCVNKDGAETHKCFNIKETSCPICMTELMISVESVTQMKCGHYIHVKCLKNLLGSTYKCPLCLKSIVDMEQMDKVIDAEVQATEMPNEYKDMDVQILCNECHKESTAKFHIFGHKCSHCGCYNTRRL